MFKKWGILIVLSLYLLVFTGYGDTAKPGESTAQKGEKAKEMTPEALGKAIGDIYVKSMTHVTQLMKAREDGEVLKPKLETFKEETIVKLVKMGKMRESMEEADKKTVDRFISMGISSIPRETYDYYNDGYKYYAGLDRITGNLIAGFNVITQYANFELLKKQNPEEAKRLGIK